MCFFFFFKQKTAYVMRISDWSSDVCSSDLSDRTLPMSLAICASSRLYWSESICSLLHLIDLQVGGSQGAATRPWPTSTSAYLSPNASRRAFPISAARTLVGVGVLPPLRIASHQREAIPAAWGQAMLVPLRASRPPPARAESIWTPGALTRAMLFEKSATASRSPPRPTAATEITSSAAADR